MGKYGYRNARPPDRLCMEWLMNMTEQCTDMWHVYFVCLTPLTARWWQEHSTLDSLLADSVRAGEGWTGKVHMFSNLSARLQQGQCLPEAELETDGQIADNTNRRGENITPNILDLPHLLGL